MMDETLTSDQIEQYSPWEEVQKKKLGIDPRRWQALDAYSKAQQAKMAAMRGTDAAQPAAGPELAAIMSSLPNTMTDPAAAALAAKERQNSTNEALRARRAEILSGLQRGNPQASNMMAGAAQMVGNVPGPQAGSIAPEAIRARALADYNRFGNGGVVLRQPAVAAAVSDEDPALKAKQEAMSRMRFVGTPGGVSEIGGGNDGDLELRRALQAQLADGKLLEARAKQSKEAREYASGYRQRPAGRPTEAQRKAAGLAAVQQAAAVAEMEHMKPYIALAAAQHGYDPRHESEAEFNRARTEMIRQQMAMQAAENGGPSPGAAQVPGAPVHVPVPGGGGITIRQPNPYERYQAYIDSLANGNKPKKPSINPNLSAGYYDPGTVGF